MVQNFGGVILRNFVKAINFFPTFDRPLLINEHGNKHLITIKEWYNISTKVWHSFLTEFQNKGNMFILLTQRPVLISVERVGM